MESILHLFSRLFAIFGAIFLGSLVLGVAPHPVVWAAGADSPAPEAVGSGTPIQMAQREAFRNHIHRQLAEIDVQLELLKTKSEELREKARLNLKAQLEQLMTQKNEILPKLESAQKSGEAAWEDLKKGIDQAVVDLKKSLELAASNFY